MNKFWERVFYIGCFLTQGSSYISANAYGILHRLHHAHTDTERDPHSPSNTPNIFMMLWETRNNYYNIYKGKTEVENKYRKGLPDWRAFDRIAHNWIIRMIWVGLYTSYYLYFATEWWMFLFLPIHFAMGALQGASVNWWAHVFGYRNFNSKDTSRNILPIDFIFWGESFHNNHHYHPSKPNNAHKWFEFDMGYATMKLMDKLHIIHLKKVE